MMNIQANISQVETFTENISILLQAENHYNFPNKTIIEQHRNFI